MVSHMKTTIELADPLLDEAKRVAAQEKTTLRALVEEGLRHVLAERSRQPGGFKLRKVTFKGEGLQPELAGAPWERLRDLSYGGRGG